MRWACLRKRLHLLPRSTEPMCLKSSEESEIRQSEFLCDLRDAWEWTFRNCCVGSSSVDLRDCKHAPGIAYRATGPAIEYGQWQHRVWRTC